MKITFDGIEPDNYKNELKNFDTSDNVSEMEMHHPTDTGEALQHLNLDAIEPGTRMSGIDMRSNLHYFEIQGLLAIDTLVNFQFLSVRCLDFTRIKKRINVSKDGQGREQIVNLVTGKKDMDAKTAGGVSLLERAANFVSLGGKKNEP